MKTAQATKDALKEQKKHLLLDFQVNKDINSLLKQLCLFIDKLLVDAWNNFDLIKSQIALVAVGGYGRGELHPFSDIDLLILTSESVSPNEQNKLSEFITCLWDSGLVVGQSIRTVKQVIEDGKKDVTIATNVLEARWLSGDQKLFQDLYASIRDADFWPSYPYFIAKRDEQRLRHKKASAFDLEPNIKNCPGGLRDIQNIAWVTMRYFNASRLEQLVDFGFLETQELRELLKCRSFLWKLRFALHMISGRDENRLLFELQPQVAKLMGYKDETQLAVELMMKDYYQTVRRVMELNQVLLQLFKRGLLDNKIILESERRLLEIQAIDENFQRRGRFIEAINGKLFDDPTQLLNLFLVILNNSDISSIYASTLRNLIHCRNALTEPLINHPQCREIFMQLLRHPRSIRAFSLMHKYGILSAYFPLWRAIEGQMQFDLFHAYTVDEHTHRLLLYIEQFATEQHQKEFPLSTQLFQTLPKKGLLVLAAIFHDIGKGRGGDHSTLGATDAIQFCKLHNMNDHDGRLVAWLVQHHLLMSITAQRRDISDPEVITQFAQTVRDSQHLSYLYCLTVADICATNPNTWNSWKGSLLRELYYSSQRALSQGIEKPIDIRARVREHQAKAKKVLERQGIRETDIDNLWSKFKADYFIKHMPNQIAWHAHAILRQKNNQEPLVLLSKHTVKGGTELFIYCPDSPMLFAIVLGILDNKNINVYDATILSSKDEHALNTFIILEQDGKNVLQNNRIQNIKQSLKKAISLGNIQSLKFRPIPRKVKSFKVNTQVNFLSSNRQDATMMELIALDTPGLLAKVGDVLYRCGIKLVAAKITTIGERAEDFFMLQNFDGTPLDENQKQLLNDNLTLSLKTSFNK